ncbi:MAG: hypothetical protein DDT21_02637 [Syntrophomonadaceae bacterium]|nr:hypothetical protein [Bacillota bacterium]
MSLPDHPVIRNMERTGYPDGKRPQPSYCTCPVCGEEKAATFYLGRREGRNCTLGCENCVNVYDVWDENIQGKKGSALARLFRLLRK